jgi:DNA mismatch endonuclease (patch repair protein)
LQTLPDFFDLDESKGRGAWATVIGNAVPPLLGVHLIEPLLCALPHDVVNGGRAALPRSTVLAANRGEATSRRRGVPEPSSQVVRDRMVNTKRRDTKPELALRSALHRMGLRFGVDRPIPGTRRRSDIMFPTEHVAVFVDGCFWHSCPQHGTVPKQNQQWWVDKLAANRSRDEATDAALQADGWTVIRFWEHHDPAAAAKQVRDTVVRARRKSRKHRSVRARSLSRPSARISR